MDQEEYDHSVVENTKQRQQSYPYPQGFPGQTGYIPTAQPMPYPGYPQGYPYANLSGGTPSMEQAPVFVPYEQGGALSVNGGLVASGVEIAAPYTESPKDEFDYSNITTPARIAIYDSMKSAPRVIQIPGGPTHEFIERIASLTYQHAQQAGGKIPYSVIREVSENFIHAQFKEVIVSILDRGNTIRFTDQGPGIRDKELAQLPGVTSATEPMKRYIRGVGSGLPLVKDALRFENGTITIEDNINQGAVVTISMNHQSGILDHNQTSPEPRKITANEEEVLLALLAMGQGGVTDLHNKTGLANSSIYAALSNLQEDGLVLTTRSKKRTLTTQGKEFALSLSSRY